MLKNHRKGMRRRSVHVKLNLRSKAVLQSIGGAGRQLFLDHWKTLHADILAITELPCCMENSHLSAANLSDEKVIC